MHDLFYCAAEIASEPYRLREEPAARTGRSVKCFRGQIVYEHRQGGVIYSYEIVLHGNGTDPPRIVSSACSPRGATCAADASIQQGTHVRMHDERIFIEVMTSDRNLKASREGSK